MSAVRVRAFAKVNLSLEVLNKREDGFHNLRTVFQTISLADVLDIDAAPSRRTRIEVQCNVEIPGENLVTRAARAVLEASRRRAEVRVRLRKRIPMGGGLGGGSTDAAAMLLALPRLLGVAVELPRLLDLAATLGSDVPFFLVGGTALGLGRGTELYPLADAPETFGILVAPDVHVSTAAAYRALGRGSDQPEVVNRTMKLTSGLERPVREWPCWNDFEAAVLPMHGEIRRARRVLARAGAQPVLMSGSGASVFGLFPDRGSRDAAMRDVAEGLPISFVSRRKYRRAYERATIEFPAAPHRTGARSSVG